LTIDSLFGKIYGAERVMLLTKKDTLRDVIEKMSLVPESKLIFVESYQGNPRLKNILTVNDIFTKIGTTV